MRGPLCATAVLALTLALAGCGGFEAPAPKRTPPPKAPPPPASTVAATLTVPVKTILDALNAKTKDDVAHLSNAPVDCLIAKCRLDLIATRSGPITGSAHDGALTLVLPFAVEAHLALKSRLFKTGAEANGQGEAIATTRLALAPDWSLKPDTVGTVQFSQGRLRLGPASTDIASIWDHNDEHLSKPLFKAMDRRVAAALKLKPEAERLWRKVLRPIRVGKKPEAWLVLSPTRIRVSDLLAENDALVVSLAADTEARVIVGPKPPEPAKLPPLPPPEHLAAPSNAFSVAVPATLSYAQAAELAMQRLQQKPIQIGRTKLRFEKIAILPSGEDVVVEARFCAAQAWDPFGWFDSCGLGYLRGKPTFDAAHGLIRIVNVHYDIATAGAILSAMKWLAGDELGKALQSKLVFDVSRDIQKLHDSINKALSKPEGRGVEITGAIDRFGAPALTWTADGFLATFTATGQIHADLNLPPPKPLAAQKGTNE